MLTISELRDRGRSIKTRDKAERRGRRNSKGYLSGRKLTAKFRKELARRAEGREETPEAQAADQTLQVAEQSAERVYHTARKGVGQIWSAIQHRRGASAAKQRHAKQNTGKWRDIEQYGAHPQAEDTSPQPPEPGERMKQHTLQEKRAANVPRASQAGADTVRPVSPPPSLAVPNNNSGSLPGSPSIHPSIHPAPAHGGGHTASPIKRRRAAEIKGRPVQAIRTRQAAQRAIPGSGGTAAAPVRGAARGALTQAQERMKRAVQAKITTRTQQAARGAAALTQKMAAALARAAAAIVSALAGLVGGGILLAAVCVVVLVAAVILSPFGIFFANQQNAPDAVSPSGAIGQIHVEYAAKLEDLQAGDYDSVQLHGQPPDWKEVLAVFAAKTAGAEDGVDVATLDPDRVDRLRAVFWDMTVISTETETIHHPGSGGDDPGWTERILHITIKARTPDDMRVFYQFTGYQNEALDELLKELDSLGGLLGDLSITQADAVALLQNLPEDLSPERRAVIQHALSLVGKLNYFWGGKSLTLGWDDRWGTTMQVTAAGSSTTGTYRPYGMDCSGYVDWVFYNASGAEYVIGHGGGAHAQHTYCTPISWDEAMPGDLVFYPDDEHVGIVGGRDESGNLLIIHCASGANNVVITGASGFTSIGRPVYFSG